MSKPIKATRISTLHSTVSTGNSVKIFLARGTQEGTALQRDGLT